MRCRGLKCLPRRNNSRIGEKLANKLAWTDFQTPVLRDNASRPESHKQPETNLRCKKESLSILSWQRRCVWVMLQWKWMIHAWFGTLTLRSQTPQIATDNLVSSCFVVIIAYRDVKAIIILYGSSKCWHVTSSVIGSELHSLTYWFDNALVIQDLLL